MERSISKLWKIFIFGINVYGQLGLGDQKIEIFQF